MVYNIWLEREAGKRDHIIVVGSRATEVAERGRIVKRNGLKPDGGILKSEVTGEWYQHWRRGIRDVSQD